MTGANGAATLSLPLQTPKSVKWDSVAVSVRADGAGGDEFANNFGLPIEPDAGGTTLSFDLGLGAQVAPTFPGSDGHALDR